MNINLSISPAPSIINKLLVVIFKASTPNTPADYQQFDPPHTNPRNLTFSNVDATTYVVNTYESTGYPTLGTLRHSFIYDPSYSKAEIRPTEYLYMTKGDTGYTDADWVGWQIESIERVGVGTQYPGVDLNYFITGNGYREDGFDLLTPGDSFSDNEKFVVRFYPRITYTTPVVQSSKLFTETAVIDTDTTIDETYNGKILLVQGSANILTLTFKSIGIIGSFQPVCIISNGGSHVNLQILSEGNTDPFNFKATQLTEINLGQSEQLQMISDPVNGWIITQASSTILMAGQIVSAYNITAEPNVVQAAGQFLSRATYRRLWLAVLDMPAGVLVSETTWNSTAGGANNKGKFSQGNGVTTFRVPKIYDVGYRKAVDGSTRIAGSYQKDQVKKFWEGSPTKPVILKVDGTQTTDDVTPDFGDEPNIVVPVHVDSTVIGNTQEVNNYGEYALIRI